MKKRIISMLLCAAMVLTLLPATVSADGAGDDGYSFDVGAGDINIGTGTAPGTLKVTQGATETDNIAESSEIVVTGTSTTDRIMVLANVRANITLDNVSITLSDESNRCAFYITEGSEVNLLLKGESTLKSGIGCAGIRVVYDSGTKTDTVLTIGGDGTLNVFGGDWTQTAWGAAAIGGNSGNTSGTIIINSGTIVAKGGDFAAGIGGGGPAGNTPQGKGGGTTIINGGTVIATGGSYGAGIGGGGGNTLQGGSGGTITVNGGTVIAAGGDYGAGIGGGGTFKDYWDSGGGSGGTIKINGGTVIATGKKNGAGIGGGGGTDTIRVGSAKVYVNGGFITATGGDHGPGIGGGWSSIARIYGGVVIAEGSMANEHIYSRYDIAATNLDISPVIIGGSAAVFLKNDSLSKPEDFTPIGVVVAPNDISVHVHQNITGHTAGDKICGVTIPWSGDFGCYLSFAALSTLEISNGTLTPEFNCAELSYSATVPYSVSNVYVTRNTVLTYSLTKMNDGVETYGLVSENMTLSVGENLATIRVRSQGDAASLTYTIKITRLEAPNPAIVGVTAQVPDGTYKAGDDISFGVEFDEPVIVTGAPRLPITVGSKSAYATCVSGNGTNTLVFKYTVVSGDIDTDGIALSSPIDPNGGTIESMAAKSAVLTFTPPDTTGILVDTTYAITLNQATGGTASVSETSAVAETEIDLTVTSFDVNYSFVRWDITPAVVWTSGSATEKDSSFTMPEGAVSITPVYLYTEPTYDITLNQATGGTAGVSHTSAKKDELITLSVDKLEQHYTFLRWDITPAAVWMFGGLADPNAVFVMPGGAVSITPVYLYTEPTYDITLNQATGGTASVSETSVVAGAEIDLTVTSFDTNYSFVRWDITPVVVWTSGSATEKDSSFTMPGGAVSITPVYLYTEPTYDTTLNQATGGTASVSETSAVAGAEIDLTVTSFDENYSFVRWDITPAVVWTSGSATEKDATFTMPGGAVSITPVYLYTEPAPSYIPQTLTDTATGITVSGNILEGAMLTVQDVTLHDDCAACDAIREKIADADFVLLFLKDISLTEGFEGELTITIPVEPEYNGKAVTILHCAGGTLKTYTATAQDGKATFTAEELSPFAVFAEKEEAPSTGRNCSLALWLCLMTVSSLGLTLTEFWNRKPGWNR